MKLTVLLALAALAAVPAAAQIQPLPEGEWTAVHRELVQAYSGGGGVANDLRTLLIYPELVKDLMPSSATSRTSRR